MRRKMMNKKQKLICCICGNECENNYGNNPYPLSVNGRCCNTCNIKVLESRFMMSQIKVGTRIVLDKDMDDPQPILKGEMGSVDFIDDMGQIHMKWDNGRTLALIFGTDEFHIISNSFKTLTIKKLEEMFKKYSLYSQDNVKDKKVILEVFIPYQNMYWLLLEGNRENDDFIFFGYCHIQVGEFGYVSYNEIFNVPYNIQYIYHSEPISLNELKNKYDM